MAFKCVEQQANRACLLSPQYEDGQPKQFIRKIYSFFAIKNITSDQHVAFLLAALPLKTYKTMEELTAPEVPEDVSYKELVTKLETLEIRKSSLISRLLQTSKKPGKLKWDEFALGIFTRTRPETRLPTIDSVINGRKAKALVDTGCLQSIITKKLLPPDYKVIRVVNVATMGGIIRCEEVSAKICHPTNGCLMDVVVLSVNQVINKYDMIMGMNLIKTCNGLRIGTGKLKLCNSLIELPSKLCVATIEIGTSKAYFDGKKWIVSWEWENEPKMKNRTSQYNVADQHCEAFNNEINEWIKEGILIKYDDKIMGKPVKVYVKVSTRDAHVINDAMREWRLMSKNSNDSVVDLRRAYLQIHVHKRHWPYQTVININQRCALTRLGFGLSLAPVMMNSILRYVLQQDSALAKTIRGYIVGTLAINGNGRKLVIHMKKWDLHAKAPEYFGENTVRALGLEVTVNPLTKEMFWKRGRELPIIKSVLTKRDIFSLCGNLIANLPVARWLRLACSYIKRCTNEAGWDEPITNKYVIEMMQEVGDKVVKCDPAKGVWNVKPNASLTVWCNASSLAKGVVITQSDRKIEDATWLRPKSDAMHINVAELDACIEGLNMALKWNPSDVSIKTDSHSVFSWLNSELTRDKPVKCAGQCEMLIRRRLQIFEKLVEDYVISVTVTWVPTTKNIANELTRVPTKWKKNKVATQECNTIYKYDKQQIRKIHSIAHMGVSKSMELCMRAGIHVTRDTVKQVVAECDECNSIDPNVMSWDKGNLAVSKVWERVACDVSHVDSSLYLTCIDCGPSRYTLSTPLSDESATRVVQALETIWSTLGPSSEVLLDNSKLFRSQLMQTMAAKWEIRLIYRAVEKPPGNGIVERVHRTVKRTNARVKCGIPMSVFLINNAPLKHGTPFEIFCQHHKRVRIPGIDKIESTQKSTTECREWKVGDKVWVKPKHITPYTQRWLKESIVALHNGLTAEVDVNGHTIICACIIFGVQRLLQNLFIRSDELNKIHNYLIELHDTKKSALIMY
nr:uncharacterized protein LOC101240105 [Hydra vulgaris]